MPPYDECQRNDHVDDVNGRLQEQGRPGTLAAQKVAENGVVG